MDRRQFIKRIGASSAALVGGPSLLQILEACGGGTPSEPSAAATPNWAGGGEIHLLQWQSFVDDGDAKMQELMTRWASQHKGWRAVLDRINGSDLQTKTSALVQAQSGPDIIQMQHNWPWLYESSCVDVSDVVQKVLNQNGNFHQAFRQNCQVKDAWRAVPFTNAAAGWVYRKDLWSQVGSPDFPTTYQDLLTKGKQLVQQTGTPFGQALGHGAFGDGQTWYATLWAFGGQEVDKDGKTVAIDSGGTRAAVEWALEAWRSGFLSHDVLSWDDTSNNKAYYAKKISATQNGASIYLNVLPGAPNADTFFAQNTWGAGPLKGPKGQAALPTTLEHAVMKWSKNQAAAKDLIAYLMRKDVFDEFMTAAKGYNTYPGPLMDGHQVWKQQPFMAIYNQSQKYSRWPGWPGPPSRNASKVLTQYVIMDMFARSVQDPSGYKKVISDTASRLQGLYGAPS
ncbi:MAG: ABC transporter substrate-binding protein [bacterium]|jgi:multiple sugar transport system substrate-binding protein|nr:ABC transporter substrate-binding protein [bacterium]